MSFVPSMVPASGDATNHIPLQTAAAVSSLIRATEEALEQISLNATDPIEERLDYHPVLDQLLQDIEAIQYAYNKNTRNQLLDFRDEYLYRQFAGNINWGKTKMLYRTDIDIQQSSRQQLDVLFPLPEVIQYQSSFLHNPPQALWDCLASVSTLQGRKTLRRLIHRKSSAS